VAAEIATTRRGEILKGNAGTLKKKKDISFDKAAEEFLSWAKIEKRLKITKTYRSIVNRSTAIETLKEIKVTTPGRRWVFMTRGRKKDGARRQYRSLKTAFTTALEHVNLAEDITPHVLRHTWASRLVMKGVDLRTLQELGGWKSLNMVQRYTHPSPEHKRQATELLVERVPTNFPTPKTSKPVSPCAPIAQVDRASAF
jgi:site-specific recombinase XerD